ncbi:MAG: flagellar basal-body MS-ring/collar protein FliF [Vulcanimicrobiota bacterium]
MDEAMKNLPGFIKDKVDGFKNADPSQKTIALTVVALLVSTLIVITIWMNKINYSVLYNNVPMEEASKITDVLKEQKVDYRLQNGGTTILVPTSKIHQLRLDLAAEGLPKKGDMGFELFDKTDFQSTEFAENIKYVRALQGELCQTINHLDAVEESKVNISIPNRSIYLDDDSEPSASVVLKLYGGASLTDDEIKGIARLIAGSTEGLKVENVTIMTTDGRLLSDILSDGTYGLSTNQIKIQNKIAKEIEKKVATLLNSVLGTSKAVVNANVQVDMEQKAVQKEIYTPAQDNAGVVRSAQTMLENYDANKVVQMGDQRDEDEDEGEVGNAPQTLGEAQEDTPVYKQKSTTTNYEVSKVVEHQTINPGEVEKVSIGVMVDTTTNLTQEQLDDLREVIASVAGIDESRGDTLTVKMIKFNAPAMATVEEPTQMEILLKKYGPMILPAFSPLLILMILLIMLRGGKGASVKKGAKERVAMDRGAAGDTSTFAPVVAEERSLGGGGGFVPISSPGPGGDMSGGQMQQPGRGMGMSPGGMGAGYGSQMGGGFDAQIGGDVDTDQVKSKLKDFAQKNPELIANLFEKWVSEGE